MKKTFGIIIGLILGTTPFLSAQQVISAAGGSGSGQGVQVSWTLGEPVIETFTGKQNILTQGFHQTRLVVTAVDPLVYPGLRVTVYPNPVSSVLRLECSGTESWKVTFGLYHSDGKLMLFQKTGNLPAMIDMENFAPGFYLLKVSRENGELMNTFKIIKN